MKNPWFHFKQFSLRQDQAAMKICTDSCVFGAWTAARMGDARRILDIGSGTGLLTLMLAQQKQADPEVCFEAIELDQLSFEQARENFTRSPWPEKITLHSGDVRLFPFPEQFDLIIVNPPFYEKQLRSPAEATNNARHETTLNLSELLFAIKRILSKDGRFSVLLPAEREKLFCRLAADEGYALADHCHLKQTPDHAPFRSLLLFEKLSATAAGNNPDYRSAPTEIIIRDKHGHETQELLEIMNDYYIR